ncbi:hypothetical protein HEP86_36625 [Streptomyces sp. RPA4-5]|nr:hypothetical protein [Streptomyces sp. RPA4-5]QIY58994.1 hypothetical protein HEP86_36625 [Streptomyces sp. RPA4-5]
MRYLIRATLASFVLGLVALVGHAKSMGTEPHTHLSADSAWGSAAASHEQ